MICPDTIEATLKEGTFATITIGGDNVVALKRNGLVNWFDAQGVPIPLDIIKTMAEWDKSDDKFIEEDMER